ncbi:alpha amylase catalytic region [Emticicia oligotrophica DSM 17448]|uniref:Alpha amylase catalytic region n=1 Tax=Emticicia oligotrophica (strain DSM 17448 / CIP 109782 / MTCC 6937 / GPTSA100-15) TaxID=929562 RepID=A0ABM5N4J0_EMTOG|nr:3-coathanger stack domain-containing protein [Emticicia oligotrophica]AFK04404.1 alpha amylase catalytic region [Emticicia oligotrophica DSM 17448]
MKKIQLLLVINLITIKTIYAQQILLQGFYWDYPKTGQGFNWSDTLKNKAPDLSKAGFTHIWFPPFGGNGNKSGGYDPKDLFIGQNSTQTSLGTKQEIKEMINVFGQNNLKAVGDMVYNHRDGGNPETNPAVKEYMLFYAGKNDGSCPGTSYKSPFPSDRVRMIIPIGGATGLTSGTYYVSIGSRSGGYIGKKIMFFATTTKAGGGQAWDFVSGCNPKNTAITINTDIAASGAEYQTNLKQGYWDTFDFANDVDEFKITLNANDFNASGDTLVIQAINLCGDYTDHRISKIWYTTQSTDIANPSSWNTNNYKLQFQTYTDFSGLPSGRGGNNWKSFRPNWNEGGVSSEGGATSTCLGPSWSMQSMDYFYDYDHNQSMARDTLIEWTKWAYDELGVRGLRMDAIKHFEANFVGKMLNAMYESGKIPDFVVGEWYGQENPAVQNWISSVNASMTTAAKAAIKPKVFDFALRDALKQACDNGADARNAFYNSFRDARGMSGFNLVTFVNNHDFRSSNPAWGDALVWQNPILAYAYILTNNQLGVPTIFYPDYYGYPTHNTTYGSDIYGFDYHPTGLKPLKRDIDQLIQVQKKFINGSQNVYYLNHYGGALNPVPSPNYYQKGKHWRSLIYQLDSTGSAGKREVIVAINFDDDSLKVNHLIANANRYPTGTKFTDILQKSSNLITTVDAQNRIFISLPPKSYTIYVQGDSPCYAYELSKKYSAGTTAKFESPNSIIASNIIESAANIKYDAAKYILLDTGFIAEKGAFFEAYIDGCGGQK